MKNRIAICFIYFIIVSSGYANTRYEKADEQSLDHAFTLLLNISEAPKYAERQELKSTYKNYVNDLKEKQQRWSNDHKTLRHVFYKTHKKFLKNYKPYQSFQDLFSTGTYGCLTGTALYAFLLDELGYEYEIIETNYHMFLLVKTSKKKYLMESTDPSYGFVHDAKDINERINEAVMLNKQESRSFSFDYDIHKSITHVELIALQYYNMAVDYYNQGNLEMVLYCLNESSRINPSVRISEFVEVLKKSIEDETALRLALLHFDELSVYVAAN